MPGPRRPVPAAVSRRVVMAGSLGPLAAVCGCDLDPRTDDPPGGGTPTAPPADADQQVVDRALREIGTAHHLVRKTSRRFPDLRQDLAPLTRLHEQHAEALGGLGTYDGARVPATEQAAAAAILVAERRLQEQLTSGAVAASSGALAALLASMAAALAQQLVNTP